MSAGKPNARRPLEGLLVVALEQAVAAPYCSSRLADAGARVIKIERPEG
ncbi:MAG: CoA transferase, partial [Rhodoblastus sp.]|nr:CoA transferase [Rhodoblastus sp.]